MSKFISHPLFGIRVYQRKDNGYLNVTNLAKALEKKENKRRDIHEWLSNKRTQEDFQHLSSETGIPVSALIQTHKGEPVSAQGTYIHPKMSIRCAIWLSSEFGFMVEHWLENWHKQMAIAQANQANEEWCQLRLFSKQEHRELTAAVKQVWQLAQTQGSKTTQDKFQMSYANLLKEHFGFESRDVLTGEKLETVIKAEHLVSRIIQECIAAGLNYKEIYHRVKEGLASTVNAASPNL